MEWDRVLYISIQTKVLQKDCEGVWEWADSEGKKLIEQVVQETRNMSYLIVFYGDRK